MLLVLIGYVYLITVRFCLFDYFRLGVFGLMVICWCLRFLCGLCWG